MLETLECACQALSASRPEAPKEFAKAVQAVDALISRGTQKLDSLFEGNAWRIGIDACYLHLGPQAWEAVRALLTRYSHAAWRRWDAPLNAAYAPAALALLRAGDPEAAAVLAAHAWCSSPDGAAARGLEGLAPERQPLRKLRTWDRHGSGDYLRLLAHPAGGELWALDTQGGIDVYGRGGAFLRRVDCPGGAADMFPGTGGGIWLCQPDERRLVRPSADGRAAAVLPLEALVPGRSDIRPLGGIAHQGLLHLRVLVDGARTQVLSFPEDCPGQWVDLWGNSVAALCASGEHFCCVTGEPQSLALYRRTPGKNQWRWRRWRFFPEGFQAQCLQALDGEWLVGGEQGLLLLDGGLLPSAFSSRREPGATERPLPSFRCFCVEERTRSLVVYEQDSGIFCEYAA